MANCSLGFEDTGSLRFVLAGVSLSTLDFMVVCGNALVIIAVLSERHLHTTTNYIITSLALSDLLLGIVVLPFSITYAMGKTWLFGDIWCQIWLALDVWICTASIYNLVAVSFDRFMAITRPMKYKLLSSVRVGKILVAFAWLASFIICLPPPIIAWSTFKPENVTIDFVTLSDVKANVTTSCECSPMNNSNTYIMYSAMGSFIIPFFLIIFFNCGIYREVRRTGTKIPGKGVAGRYAKSSNQQVVLRIHRGCYHRESDKKATSKNTSPAKLLPHAPKDNGLIRVQIEDKASEGLNLLKPVDPVSPFSDQQRKRSHSGSEIVDLNRKKSVVEPSTSSKTVVGTAQQGALNKKRLVGKAAKLNAERCVAKTVGIVVGCYVLCWMPFAIVYLLQAYDMCSSLNGCMPQIVNDVCFWLGYCNSTCNPIIYALFSRDFRRAFRHIFGKCILALQSVGPGDDGSHMHAGATTRFHTKSRLDTHSCGI